MNPFLVSGLRGLAALGLAALPLFTLAATETFYIHADHLDTPRLIANQTGQTVWQWDNDDPFGGNMANQNPGGLGTFTFNLRFPGQYFDSETNNHYNYFRDYSPEIGRYIESDPIGLAGGINTYTYANGNPLSFSDPTGEAAVGGVAAGAGIICLRFPEACRAAARAIIASIGIGLGGIVSEICGNDDECRKQREQDESLCVAIAGVRYGSRGLGICMASAATRYAECLRFGVNGITTPLHGVDTPL